MLVPHILYAICIEHYIKFNETKISSFFMRIIIIIMSVQPVAGSTGMIAK